MDFPTLGPLLEHLAGSLPKSAFKEAQAHYFEDPRGVRHGQQAPVLAPGNVEEAALILSACNAHRVPVVPYSGGTGLVAGQVKPNGAQHITLSSERLDRIRDIDWQGNTAIVEAGVILQNFKDVAAENDRIFPLSLASQGSCRIGGNLATNAGGMNVLRYGNTRDLCLGLEVVLADGTVWNGLNRLRKDNTGYDLKDLFVGSEGTLGFITAASLRLFPAPCRRAAGLFVVRDPSAALEVLGNANDLAGEFLSAFELISSVGLDFLDETMPDFVRPVSESADWLVLIDLETNEAQDPEKMIAAIFERSEQSGAVEDGYLSQSEAQRDAFLAMRETIPIANKNIGSISSHDVSVPVASIPEFIKAGTAAMAKISDIRVNCFGHMGDGNLHFNAFPAKGRSHTDYEAVAEEISQKLYDCVHRFGGSFSAEHGIGRLKVNELAHFGDPGKMHILRQLKASLDPNNIMNPGAVLADENAG